MWPDGGRSSSGRSCCNHSAQEKRPIEPNDLARTIARIIDDKQGEDICILDVSGPLVIADAFVIASARNARHARAIASEVAYQMKQEGRPCRNRATGDGDGRWALLDFGDVVVHVFQDEARAFYDLEGLWADVPRVEWQPASRSDARENGWGSLPRPAVPDSGSKR